MVDITDEALDAAAERGRIERETKPHATLARYDRQADRIVIELTNGATFMFPPRVAQDLEDATPDQLAEIELSPAGSALHWPQIDVDFSVAGLLAGIFGTAKFMEAQRRGGQSRSAAKTAAARALKSNNPPRDKAGCRGCLRRRVGTYEPERASMLARTLPRSRVGMRRFTCSPIIR